MAASPLVSIAAELRLVSRNKLSEVTVRPRGPITSATCLALERDLVPKFQRIVLDVSGVDHIDNSALGSVVGLYLEAKRADCDLVIDNPRPRLGNRFRNWLHEVFEGHEELLGDYPRLEAVS